MSTESTNPSAEAPAAPTSVGRAPDPDGLPAPRQRTSPATSRALWIGAYLLITLLMVLRIPQTYGYVSERVPPEMAEGIGDPEMESLALRSAIVIGLILTAFIVALYFSLAAVLEKKVFTARIATPGGLSFGLFFLIMVLCFVPTQTASLAFGIADPRESLFYYLYIFAVAIAAPWIYRRVWKGLPVRKIVILFTASVGMASLTAVGLSGGSSL